MRRGWLLPLGAALLAALLADVLGRAAGWGALGPADGRTRSVALTFDDGPSGRTPALLAVLARHGAPATFFVTAPAAARWPDHLRALREAGHGLEAHGRWHTHALRLPPWREWAQVKWHPRAAEPGPHLYRPPYGGHSPFTRLLARLARRQVALWDVEGRDWTPAPAADLAARTLARVRPGSVLLLHDGPAVTPELLEALLAGLRERGLTPVLLRDLPPRRIGWREGLRRVGTSYGG
ncbi:polysaccharide deacetylase [Deinococcus metallilatus]|uniref:Peptidoglycan/xylan/chitin deacetylase (PgdA/CDA1 family) n=1 Tax=Deinococcus metallilatus TaxID=1211322 RepID=A0AAJ5F3Q6_9DEIO|nr:polysaccharide deacetylase family protein [Deinococcus metallilatus]MBB5295857.1 peptidoglycan/xylan/chitin deacetylase (PgdA/CDA1 family) [Deinococcus metallilatus]QBY08302.1 polysaccharide deacetylase [Deinococcus metallilatus]RXJ12033.1 polysaccharide deacetylase [Deinococcus metallilatus]TLK25735.1 polysaccharide deacetylase [Deinococcus metallilatus]GMA14612.1 polysaccharide deacetylase [Deinococcus metallilatus]